MPNSEKRDSEFLETGRRVIAREAKALAKLAESIDSDFVAAAEVIARAPGRVIVSGMGKSGHIGRKIAATLASTGRPAHFLHLSEASHGDLGMLMPGDVAVALSFSGETPELANLIAHTKRLGIPLIGIAGTAASNLIRRSDVGIVLPKAKEACDRGIVPTTSAIMTLAVGDALAVALMNHRRFTPEQFREFHPGGNLGARLSKVRDIMHTGSAMPLVNDDMDMAEALLEMTRKGFGVAGILSDSGRLIGIITDGDLRRNMDGLLENRILDVMTADPLTISPGALVEEAVAFMNQRKITCLFVALPEGDGSPEGVLHIHDCLRAGVQ